MQKLSTVWIWLLPSFHPPSVSLPAAQCPSRARARKLDECTLMDTASKQAWGLQAPSAHRVGYPTDIPPPPQKKMVRFLSK